MQKAIFAAGCFWGVQHYFDQVPGVTKSVVGYTGGHVVDSTYEAVCRGGTGHAEAALLEFDSSIVSYKNLVRHFFRIHDPTQFNRQGPDVGEQYRSAIFYFDDAQKRAAEHVRDSVQSSLGSQVVTQLAPAGEFYIAEEYHQKYVEKTGRGMCHVPCQQLA